MIDPKRTPEECLNQSFPSPPPGAVGGVEQAQHLAQAWLDATMEHWSSIAEHRELPYAWAFSGTPTNISVRATCASRSPAMVLSLS
jgi:hypothetical protein